MSLDTLTHAIYMHEIAKHTIHWKRNDNRFKCMHDTKFKHRTMNNMIIMHASIMYLIVQLNNFYSRCMHDTKFTDRDNEQHQVEHAWIMCLNSNFGMHAKGTYCRSIMHDSIMKSNFFHFEFGWIFVILYPKCIHIDHRI